MKKVALVAVFLALAALFSLNALAENKAETKELSFTNPTVVGDKLLPAGTYRVTINEDSLSFMQTRVSKNKAAEGKVSVSPEKIEKAKADSFMLRNNDKNQPVLLSVTFRGQQTRYVVK